VNDAAPHASARDRAPADDEAGRREALSGDERERREAALALVDSATGGLAPATVAALAERAREDDSPAVRQFAVEALGEAGAGVEAIDAALEDPEPWVRAEAVVAFSRAAPERTDRLEAALAEDDDGMVRRNALIALGKTGTADRQTLVEYLKSDPHPAVREYAAQFLPAASGEETTEETVRLLAAVLAREPNAFVRAKAAEGLGELGTDRAIEALETQGLEDRSDDVQRTARHALAEARGEDPADIDLPEPAAPGGGPGSRSERDGPGGPAGQGPETGFGPGPGAGPGSGPAGREGRGGRGDRPTDDRGEFR
jgi:HEAT repeat protein